jgi:hypothetical protein
MTNAVLVFIAGVLGLVAAASVAADPKAVGQGTSREAPSASWFTAWRDPPLADRPMQIIHGVEPRQASMEGMRRYLDLGLGGVVANVSFRDYLRSETNWKTLAAAVDACRRLGLGVWIYDEEGYPSGAAGGLVLAENREYEALLLVYDPTRRDPFFLRPGYEFTHATSNYHAARRYINLADDRAVACFLRTTHDAYWQHLQPHFGRTIQAFFTDEPSLMSVPVGPPPEKIRGKLRIVDPVDPGVQPLPSVPWAYDLPERYRQRYGEDLIGQRRSLFEGYTAEDRRIRRQFWALVADLVSERFFGQIQQWCGRHGVASSGHTLHEETILAHGPLEGNGLKVLERMDIPGLDMLSSDPGVVLQRAWMAAAMPCSAALLEGRRRVMTEVSDFSQKMGDRGPAPLAQMQAAAAWQAAWGVTDFTLYYKTADRSADDYRAYCTYVGRLNAVLKPATLDSQVLLYYPIEDLWEEYRPVTELTTKSQSPRAQRIIASFMNLGQTLVRSQIPFCLIDHEKLAVAAVTKEGNLNIGGHGFAALIVPDGVEMPEEAAASMERFRRSGGQVLIDGATSFPASALEAVLRPAYRLVPASQRIILGRFMRDEHPVLLLVNVGKEPYAGHLTLERGGTWRIGDPASGNLRLQAAGPLIPGASGAGSPIADRTDNAPRSLESSPETSTNQGKPPRALAVSLAGYQALLLVHQ